MRIDVLTLFPGMFRGFLDFSILKLAIQRGLIDVRISNIRNFTYDRHRQVDDPPYGGGAGMLLRPEPIFRAVEAIWHPPEITPKRILLTPQGRVFDQHLAERLSRERHLILICGHYEGFDERVRTGLELLEISIGDYILSGGEIPAMVVVDTVARLLPEVLGSPDSLAHESFSGDCLEYPQYTRPPEWRGMKVPDVLCSGHHAKIKEWQEKMAVERTRQRRPDLYSDHPEKQNLQ